MTIFDEIAITVAKIKKIQDKIKYLEMTADTPRSSVFSDMPKGGGNASNPLEQYMIKKDELNDKLKPLKKRLKRQWAKAAYRMNMVNIDEQTKKMMYLRFCRGMQWDKCAKVLNNDYPDCKWNTNKCFRKYREVLYRLRCFNREKHSS